MSAPNQEAVLKALSDFIAFVRKAGFPKAVQPLERYKIEFQTAKPPLKILQDTVRPLRDSAFNAIRFKVMNAWDEPKPGKKKEAAELIRTFQALEDVIFPPKDSGMPVDIVGLAGNKENTSVLGDPKDAKKIAKKSLDVVTRFSRTVFKQDIETAYALCANELRTWISVDRFVTDLQKADTRFGGPAVDLVVESITWIYADEASRKRSNSDGQWPKNTPKPNKRSLVGTFWFTNKMQERGRAVFFWVTEEAEGYRIAKFNQYLQ